MSYAPFIALRDGHSMDFRYEDNPKCPHCGQSIDVSHNDLWNLYEEGEHDVECPLCEGAFVVSTNVKYTFSTDEQEGYE